MPSAGDSRNAPAAAWAHSSASTVARRPASPPHAWSRNASRSSAASISNARLKISGTPGIASATVVPSSEVPTPSVRRTRAARATGRVDLQRTAEHLRNPRNRVSHGRALEQKYPTPSVRRTRGARAHDGAPGKGSSRPRLAWAASLTGRSVGTHRLSSCRFRASRRASRLRRAYLFFSTSESLALPMSAQSSGEP